MLWSAFACTGDYLSDKEPIQFQNLNNTELIALNQNQAKREMLFDLLQCLEVEDETDTDFQSILDEHTVFLREALANKQLFLYWLEHDAGEGSAARRKIEYYKDNYDNAKIRFSKLINDIIRKPQSLTIVR